MSRIKLPSSREGESTAECRLNEFIAGWRIILATGALSILSHCQLEAKSRWRGWWMCRESAWQQSPRIAPHRPNEPRGASLCTLMSRAASVYAAPLASFYLPAHVSGVGNSRRPSPPELTQEGSDWATNKLESNFHVEHKVAFETSTKISPYISQ